MMQRTEPLPVPMDVLRIILKLVNDPYLLVPMRLVARLFRYEVDKILYTPESVLRILAELSPVKWDDWEAAQKQLITQYENHKLTKIENPTLPYGTLAILERFSLIITRKFISRVNIVPDFTYYNFLELCYHLPKGISRYHLDDFHRSYLGFSLNDIYMPLTQLSSGSLRPECHPTNPYLFNEQVILPACITILARALFAENTLELHVPTLNHVLSFLSTHDLTKQDEVIQGCLVSLRIIIASRNYYTIPECEKIIKNGSPAYINLRRADLQGYDLRGANLAGANLHYAKLEATQLQFADLTGANLMSANLQRAQLQSSRLDGALLTCAYLLNANFTGASLRKSILYRALPINTNFEGVDFEGADFSMLNWYHHPESMDLPCAANFSGANLRNTKWFHLTEKNHHNVFIYASPYDFISRHEQASFFKLAIAQSYLRNIQKITKIRLNIGIILLKYAINSTLFITDKINVSKTGLFAPNPGLVLLTSTLQTLELAEDKQKTI